MLDEVEGLVDNAGTVDAANIPDPNDAGNPAWAPLYEVLPSQLHSQVRPVLEQWDKGTQAKFNEYGDQLKQYEPYKNLVDNQIPADYIEQAVQIAQLIDADPKAFMQQLQSIFGDQQPQTPQGQPAPQQQQQQTPTDENLFDEKPFDITSDPRFQELAKNQDILANYLATQAQANDAAQADAMLNSELQSLQQKYGEFDERYVITLGASGMDLEAAVQQYQDIVGKAQNTPRSDANVPSIISPSGSVPQERVNVAELTVADRKKLVMNMLAQASQQQG
jgi:hypothetical protein